MNICTFSETKTKTKTHLGGYEQELLPALYPVLLNLTVVHRQTVAMPALVKKVNITQKVCASYSIIDPVLLEVEDLGKRRIQIVGMLGRQEESWP